jgi:hypothetical protein
VCFYGVFVRFSTRGVQKHHKKLFGGSPCRKLFAKNKTVEGIFRLLPFFPFGFFIAFLAVASLHDELENTINTLSKIRPESLKKKKKEVGR